MYLLYCSIPNSRIYSSGSLLSNGAITRISQVYLFSDKPEYAWSNIFKLPRPAKASFMTSVLLCVAFKPAESVSKDLKTVVQENKLKIEQYVADCERKELASKYKNLSDTDVESIGYQIQILEKIRNKQKSENNFNE